MKVSVIIPAYNEETTIERCLANLLEGSEAVNIQIIVVCNGCSDTTAEKARFFEPKVKVVEIETGSKILALNTGDALASYFPRFYIDADIIVSQKSLWVVAKTLESGKVLAAAPQMKIDLRRTSKMVKAYYRTWLKTPYTSQGMLGSGIYGMSLVGRERFGEFPDIISDDGFVRLQYNSNERKTVEEAEFTIIPPVNLRWLIAINTRAMLGNIELNRKYPELFKHEEGGNHSIVISKLLNGTHLMDTLIYIFIKLYIRLNAKRRLLIGNWKIWDHDPTARENLIN